MISWNNLVRLLIGAFLSFSTFSNAQTVSYYKLTKTKIGGVVSSTVSGGQFICFFDGVCFDSDKNGVGVGNGQLNLISKDETDVYYGQSYFGKGSYYKFDKSHQKLNVIAPNGDIYAYTRSDAPRGVSTSSLIKSASNSQSQKESSYSGGDYLGNNNSGFVIGNAGTNQSGTVQELDLGHMEEWEEDCPVCGGKGEIIEEKYIGSMSFGLGGPYKKRCDLCNKEYMSDFSHVHKECKTCDKKGKVHRKRYRAH